MFLVRGPEVEDLENVGFVCRYLARDEQGWHMARRSFAKTFRTAEAAQDAALRASMTGFSMEEAGDSSHCGVTEP